MDAVETANELGLFGPSIESFFETQISVAKAIQYRYRADWQSESPSFVPLNLKKLFAQSYHKLENPSLIK